jgi:hypothetical protein
MLKNGIFAICLAALSLAGALLLSGCTTGQQDNAGWNPDAGGPDFGPGGNPGGNMTEEERQAMLEERMRAAAEACAGKGEGDACSMQGFGGGSMDGTCATSDAGISCTVQMGEGRGQWGNRTGGPPPQQ